MGVNPLPIHDCVVCRDLPLRPFDPADVDPEVEYRPKTPRPTVSGGPRSRVCKTHERAKARVRKATQRATHKQRRFGLSADLQLALWVFQGSKCPCGRKAAAAVPAGVTLDHDHAAECIVRGDHVEDQGCVECVTGFVCAHCNQEILGRLEGSFRKALEPRTMVREALRSLADHLGDPPLRRLLAERPDLLERAS